MDLHAPQIQGFFNIPVDHLVGAPLLANYFKKLLAEDRGEQYVVVSPDLGVGDAGPQFCRPGSTARWPSPTSGGSRQTSAR